MKLIFSGLINDARNKCGDVVFSRNHYGTFVRVRKDTPPTTSPFWTYLRDQTILLSKEWSTLLESQRQAWNESAKLFKRSDPLGLSYYQTGLNFFVGNNINRWQCGEATSFVPPMPVAVPNFEALTLVANSAIPEKILSFSPAINPLIKVKLFCTSALNAGINRAFHQYRLLKILDDSFTSGSDIETDFTTRFLSSGSMGAKIFIKAIFVDLATGLVGQPIYANSIIV